MRYNAFKNADVDLTDSDQIDIKMLRAEFTKVKIMRGLESLYLSPKQVFEKLDTQSDELLPIPQLLKWMAG